MIETVNIPLTKIEANKGQIGGVPCNPRILDADDYNKLVNSIETNPEMLLLRELLVYKHCEKYVVIGGNMRYHVLKALQYKEAPCKIIPEGTSADKLRELVIKDNVTYGQWDEALLREDWKDDPLEDWGISLQSPFDETEDKPKDESKGTMSVAFTPDQFRFVKQALNNIDKDNSKALIYLISQYGN